MNFLRRAVVSVPRTCGVQLGHILRRVAPSRTFTACASRHCAPLQSLVFRRHITFTPGATEAHSTTPRPHERLHIKPEDLLTKDDIPPAPTPVELPSLDSVEEYVQRARQLRKEGDLVTAIADVTRAIDLDDKQFVLYELRGELREAHGDYNDALHDYAYAAELAPDYMPTRVAAGRCHHLVGELSLAAENFDFVLAREPQHVGAMMGRAELFLTNGDLNSALQTAEKLLQVQPTNVTGLLIAAQCRLQTGDLPAGVHRLRMLLMEHPHVMAPYAMMAAVKMSEGDMAASVEYLTKAIELNETKRTAPTPEELEAHATSRGVTDVTGNFTTVVTQTDNGPVMRMHAQGLFTFPQFDLLAKRAMAYVTLGDAAKALADADRALALRADYSLALLPRAQALMEMMRYGDAIEGFSKFIAFVELGAEAESASDLVPIRMSRAYCRLEEMKGFMGVISTPKPKFENFEDLRKQADVLARKLRMSENEQWHRLHLVFADVFQVLHDGAGDSFDDLKKLLIRAVPLAEVLLKRPVAAQKIAPSS